MIYKCYALCYVPAHLIPDYHNSVIADAVDEGQEQDPAWEDQEIEEFGMYMLNTWIERRGGRPPLFPPQVWSQYDAIMEDKVQTNNILEWFNRTWNSLVGTSSNVWTIQQAFVKRYAEARRIFLNNAVGLDLNHHSGGRQRSLDNNRRIKFVVEAFEMTFKGLTSNLSILECTRGLIKYKHNIINYIVCILFMGLNKKIHYL